MVFRLATTGGNALGGLILFVLFSGVVLLACWLLTRGLGRSRFVIDPDGMEVRTPRGSRRVIWSDMDDVAVVAEQGGQLLLATLRAGVTPPTPSAIGFPRWSATRRCLVVMTVESFDTTPAEVRTALQRHAGAAFRGDAGL